MKKTLLLVVAVQMTVAASIYGQTVIPVDSLQKHVYILSSDSLSGRGFGFPEKQMAVDYILEQYTQAGFKPLGENFLHTFPHLDGLYFVEGKNVIGVIEGSDPFLKNEYIVLGAHYDHMGWKLKSGEKIINNGADDNASGVASIIEIGKALKDAGLKRSIIIAAFDGEEAGLLGSKAFTTDSEFDISMVKAMFSLDMVGMLEKNEGLDLDGINSLKNGKELATRIASAESIEIKSTKNTITPNTDTWSFGKKYIPAVHVFTGLKSPYHKPGDDAEFLDYEGMSAIDGYMTALVSDMANMEEIESNSRFIRRAIDPRFLIGYRLNIGFSSYNYDKAFFNTKSIFAFEAGIISKLKLTRGISLQPEISYNTSGARTMDGNLRMHSVIPALDLLLTTPAADASSPSSFLSIGGYYKHNFAASMGGSSFDFNEKYNVNEKGLRLGFGVLVNRFEIQYLYEYGFDRVNKIADDGDYYHSKGFYLSVVKFF